jgi:hypothetical protein
MVDSDNTTTLLYVTRRKMLSGTAIAMGAWGSGAFAVDTVMREASSDPVLTLWRQWQDAHCVSACKIDPISGVIGIQF